MVARRPFLPRSPTLSSTIPGYAGDHKGPLHSSPPPSPLRIRVLRRRLPPKKPTRESWSGGVRYVLIVLWEVRHRLVGYQLVRSDWLWYTLLPLISYTALVVVAILLPISPGPVLFIIAAMTLLLLFTGIHNAWDVVTYMAIEHSQPQETSQD